MEGRQRGCSVGALLFVGNKEIREWVEEQEVFTRSIKVGEESFRVRRATIEEGIFRRSVAS
jgi:hypothetical protein